MQLVRTLTGRRERTLSRKLGEIALAIYIRRRFGANIIINHYLAVAYTGAFLRGMQVAALWLFGRSAEACSWEEKASLAALLLVPAPEHLTASWSLRLERRAAFARNRAGNSPKVRQTFASSDYVGDAEGLDCIALSSLVQSHKRNFGEVVRPLEVTEAEQSGRFINRGENLEKLGGRTSTGGAAVGLIDDRGLR
jgi:hypothetical protein